MPDEQPETQEEPVTPEAVATPQEPDYKDLYQRALAEGENRRKRLEQDQATRLEYALQGFADDLLPVVDNFYRATEHVPAEQKGSSWVAGIQHIQKQLLDVLESHGVREIPAKPGDPFDPASQEALSTQPSDGVPDHCLVSVVNRGYTLKERILRPVQVIVSSGPSSTEQAK